MSETIELHERYPQSRREDITDAFMRGAECGRDIAMAENAKLRELVADMWRRAMQLMDYAERYTFAGEFVDSMREMEVEVNA